MATEPAATETAADPASAAVLTPEEAQAARLSPADLEVGGGYAPAGEPRIVKANPEMPNAQQVEAATGEQSGPAAVKVTVTDGDGNETEAELYADDEARLNSAFAANTSDHPSNQASGHWSNPALAQWGDDEEAVKANEEAYAARTAS